MKWPFRARWSIDAVAAPWDARAAILPWLKSARPDADPSRRALDLPDDDAFWGTNQRWVAGARDGVATHHGAFGGDDSLVRGLWDALIHVTENASDSQVRSFYELARKGRIVGMADGLVSRARRLSGSRRDRAARIARWLVGSAPDREAVKLGIVLLGVLGDAADRAAIDRLARHEEFTLFGVVALSNLGLADEIGLWEVAKAVHGWGRVHIVERIAESKDPRIKRWLVREGFRNSVMDEYLALLCAEGGDLVGELSESEPEGELLDAAAGLLRALAGTTLGGPASGFESYARGAEATERFLRHSARRAGSLDQLIAAHRLGEFAQNGETAWEGLASGGWTPEARRGIATLAEQLLRLPFWRPMVVAAVEADDRSTFYRGSEAADALGLDVWEVQFTRLQRTGDGWWHVCRTSDPSRIARVVEHAERSLPLERIASGPASERGLGDAWKDHQALGLVLQELGKFPGLGWQLIRAGLRSPVTWTRQMATRALSAWPMAERPQEAQAVVERAIEEEPEPTVRESLEQLLRGERVGPYISAAARPP